jgi:hypothetical protein
LGSKGTVKSDKRLPSGIFLGGIAWRPQFSSGDGV